MCVLVQKTKLPQVDSQSWAPSMEKTERQTDTDNQQPTLDNKEPTKITNSDTLQSPVSIRLPTFENRHQITTTARYNCKSISTPTLDSQHPKGDKTH